MESYMSYYTFFSDNAKLIKDVQMDFESSGLSGNAFDKAYSAFLNKFTGRCHSFASNTFRGSSSVISQYIAEMEQTRNGAQGKRFSALLQITDTYMRRAL